MRDTNGVLLEKLRDGDSTMTISSSKEDLPLLENWKEVTLYKRRWYVLAVFSFVALLQAAVWNTFGPIAQSAKLVFGWTDANVGMLANWGNIMYFIFMIPMAWLMDVKGLRVSLLVCVALVMVGSTIRCLTSEPHTATWLINIGSLLNGIGGTVPFAGPSLLSSTWFPPKQRATATAICMVMCYLGLSVSFIIGPLLVPEPDEHLANITNIDINKTSHVLEETVNVSVFINTTVQRNGIMTLLYLECGVSVVLFFMVLAYFPDKPPSPPSISASLDRTDYIKGLKQLFTHKRFLLILMAYSIPTGVYGVFGSVLNVILNNVNISQKTSGWIGFYSTIGGCISALVLSRISDLFMRHMKAILISMFVLATAATTWFVVTQLKEEYFNIASIYISAILIGMFINGSVPLFFELGCESSYPIAEGVTAGSLTLINNLTGIIFLSVLQIPNIGVLWMNWTLLGCVTIAIPILLLLKEQYGRTDIDTQAEIIIPAPKHEE